jgi:predicted PurR-regulated permease PerM
MERPPAENRARIFFAVAVAVVALLYLARHAIAPFFVAFALAYLLDPVVDRMQGKGIPRAPAVLLLISLFLGSLFLAGALLLPLLQAQAEKLARHAPEYVRTAQQWIDPVIRELSAVDPDQARKILGENMQKFGELPMRALSGAAAFVWNSVSGLFGLVAALLGLAIVPVATFYLLRDFDAIAEKLAGLVPPAWRADAAEAAREIAETLSAFVRGQLAAATLMAALYAAGLFLCGTPMSLALGVLAGYANLVPYLGIVFGFLPAALLTYLHYQEWLPVAGVLAVFGVVQVLEGMAITPRLVGDRVGLHPVAVMAAVLLGADWFGFLGILLAVPAAAVANVLLRRGLARYKNSAYYS